MLRLLLTTSTTTRSFQFNPTCHLSPDRPFSTKKFVDSLVNSHGFSPDAAVTASNLFPPKAAKNVDSVLNLLKSYSFTPDAMSTFITRYPALASDLNPKILKPKLDFLSEFGMSGDNLITLLCKDAHLISRSLDNQFVPAVTFLVRFLGSKSAVVSLFASRNGRWVLRNCSESTELNVSTLLAFGVPRSNILKLLTLPTKPLTRNTIEFGDMVAQVMRFGFKPRSKNFINGVAVVAGTTRSKLDARFALLNKYGFSDEQAKVLFVKQPTIMGSSLKRIERGLKLFLIEWGWNVQTLLDHPLLLMSSIDRKILPRKSIFLLLLSKGRVKKSDEVSMLLVQENMFLSRFLLPHVEEVPQILEMYRSSKLRMLDDDDKSGDVRIPEVNAL